MLWKKENAEKKHIKAILIVSYPFTSINFLNENVHDYIFLRTILIQFYGIVRFVVRIQSFNLRRL